VQNGQPVALQEAVVVARDIFRRFPNRYEKLVKDLVEKVAEYSEPEARASIAWIIGEQAEKITDCHKVFQEYFISSFLEEPDTVKLQILTASVKLFLKLPDECEDMITNILTTATEQVSNPDIKDRAYIYWRMLSTSPQKA
jgi:AP-1 complex subunit beta-1